MRKESGNSSLDPAFCLSTLGVVWYHSDMDIVIASNNQGKIREIREILKDKFEHIYSLKELGIVADPEENADTFYGNALIKAREICKIANIPALADDSGLCVSALNGGPGVYSARYSGEDATDAKNNAKLLEVLKDVQDRSAKFVSSVVICYPDGSVVSGVGETHGEILRAPQGQNGFGYDCLFFSNDLKKSFGEAGEDEKNSVSHRFRALCDLLTKL